MFLQVHPRQWENKKNCLASCNCNTHELWDNKHSRMESNEKLPAEKRPDFLRPPPCFVLQSHPKLNLHDVSLTPTTKERFNYKQRLQHILRTVFLVNVGGNTIFCIGRQHFLKDTNILQDRLLAFCLVKLCHSWTIPDKIIESNLEVPLKAESVTIPGQLKPRKVALDSFLSTPIMLFALRL